MPQCSAIKTKRYGAEQLKHRYRVQSFKSSLLGIATMDQLSELVSSESREAFNKAWSAALAGSPIKNCEISIELHGSPQRICIDLTPAKHELSNLIPRKLIVNVRAVIE